MSFIKTTSAGEANGDVYDMYARQQGRWGYVPNYAKIFCYRPELMKLWADLLAGIRSNIAPREFELATLSTAHALKNSACSLAHSQQLLKFYSVEEVVALVTGDDCSGLSEQARAIATFSRKAATNAPGITVEDVETLRRAGLKEAEIFDVAITVAARAFFTTLLDTLGVEPDAATEEMDERLRQAMVVGRKIATDAPEILTA